ncbi:PIG-L family deacetylase [Paenibacillus frigoriresistens]|uniref:PIG-L deacetylase family protein n=1 Tax=Paenibacillus alginolyticus TaxID=59839 RepID=UPI0015661371|nr:PIG-L deacetylase family protein [Paenibacillus frigoriresistens]NRF93670.1 PIG-L family deacetylase [Paenibacillus frigoriresistens]
MSIVAVIASHPDDELLGLGGTIAKRVKAGDTVVCLILGEGITSRTLTRDDANPETVNYLHKHVQDAAKILGFTKVELAKLPDNRFDSVDLLDIIKVVEDFIERWKPEIIYTHFSHDLNIDHQRTHQAVLTATRPVPGQNHIVKELYAFETPSATEWNFSTTIPFRANVFVDVTDTLQYKLDAMACYKTESRDYPHPRSLQALKIIAERWGTVCGVKYAEAFQLIRKII